MDATQRVQEDDTQEDDIQEDDTQNLRDGAVSYFAAMRTLPWNARLSDYYSRMAMVKRIEHRSAPTPSREPSNMDMALHQLRKSRRGTEEFHGCMSLPCEIRDMVYRLLVVEGTIPVSFIRDGEVISWNSSGETASQFMILPKNVAEFSTLLYTWKALSLVNKPVWREATCVFYRVNRFIFPLSGPWLWPRYICGGDDDPAPGIPRQHFDMVITMRDVSYAFKMADAEISDIQNVLDVGGWDSFEARLQPGSQRTIFRKELHDNKLSRLQSNWRLRMSCIERMRLERLQLSFDECWCGSRCCRMVEWVCRLPRQSSWLPTMHHGRHWGPEDRWGTESLHAPRRIEVLGWGNDEEKCMIETELAPLKKLGTKEINFVGQSLSQAIEDARIQTPESP